MDAWNLFQKERNTVSEYFWSCDSFTQPIYSPLLLISWNLNRSLLHKVTPNTTRDSCTVQPECLVQSGRFIVPIFHAYSWLCACFSLPPAWNILSFRFWSQLRASSSMKNSWILQPSVTPSVDVCCLTPHPSFPPSEVPHSVWQVLLGRVPSSLEKWDLSLGQNQSIHWIALMATVVQGEACRLWGLAKMLGPRWTPFLCTNT